MNMIGMNTIKSNIAVPKSGCLIINTTGTAINIRGQIIQTIVNSYHTPGNYEIIWDSINYYGMLSPSGIYYYKMNATNYVDIKKLVDFCESKDIFLLRTVGVIFSDNENRTTQYIK